MGVTYGQLHHLRVLEGLLHAARLGVHIGQPVPGPVEVRPEGRLRAGVPVLRVLPTIGKPIQVKEYNFTQEINIRLLRFPRQCPPPPPAAPATQAGTLRKLRIGLLALAWGEEDCGSGPNFFGSVGADSRGYLFGQQTRKFFFLYLLIIN